MKAIKSMKKCWAVVGAATLLVAPSVFASMSYDGVYTGTIQVYNDGAAIKAVTSGLGTFTTFCLNEEALAQSGQVYNYVSSGNVVPANHNISPNPVVLGTAWVYSQFLSGSLSSYSLSSIQEAIWFFEGSTGGVENSLAQLAETTLGPDYDKDSEGAYGVFALILTDGAGNYAQPVLGHVGAVPEPSTIVAGALLLLPFGVSTIRILRKNKTA